MMDIPVIEEESLGAANSVCGLIWLIRNLLWDTSKAPKKLQTLPIQMSASSNEKTYITRGLQLQL